jgi:NAD:arginine ADP-ribosyltransferase
MSSLSRTSEPRAGLIVHGPAGAATHDRSIGRNHVSGRAGRILALQRAAGNRAVSSLLAGQTPLVVQRLSVRSADLAPHLTNQSKVERAVAPSTFGKIERTLTGYEKAGSDLELRAGLLQQLDVLCTNWYNKHARSSDPRNVARRGFVQALLDSIPVERAALSRHHAQETYLTDLRAKRGSEGAFQALTSTAKLGTKASPKRAANVIADASLTEAEVAAIVAYTADDYKYINPVVANSAGWLIGQKGKAQLESATSMLEGVPEDFLEDVHKRADDAKKGKKVTAVPATSIVGSARPLVEEAGLHAGVALQGLRKLPAFTKDTYRGERITPADFRQKYAKGKVFPFNAFGSSSWDKEVGSNYAHGLSGDNPPAKAQTVAVLQIISNSGGRDISELSMVPDEREVVILPGSKFVVNSMRKSKAADFPNQVQRCNEGSVPVPKQWWVVKMSPASTEKSESRKPPKPTSTNIDGT